MIITSKVTETNYPGFNYKATDLSAYLFSIDTFIISLKNGRIVHFVVEDDNDFKIWLTQHGIRDINKDDGISKAAQIIK
jgi:hypothetical protein